MDSQPAREGRLRSVPGKCQGILTFFNFLRSGIESVSERILIVLNSFLPHTLLNTCLCYMGAWNWEAGLPTPETLEMTLLAKNTGKL